MYEYPKYTFIGNFIELSSINLITRTLTNGYFMCRDTKISISKEKDVTASKKAYINKDVNLEARAENIQDEPFSTNGNQDPKITALIDVASL